MGLGTVEVVILCVVFFVALALIVILVTFLMRKSAGTSNPPTSPNQALKDGDPASGDLGGSYPSPTVTGIQGNPVADIQPSDGDVLTWVAGRWEPRRPE